MKPLMMFKSVSRKTLSSRVMKRKGASVSPYRTPDVVEIFSVLPCAVDTTAEVPM